MAKQTKGGLILRNGVYYADWSFKGKRYRVTTGETTEREARKRLAEIVSNFSKGNNAAAVLESVKESLQKATRRTLRISDAWAVYENNKLRKAVAASTLLVYKYRFGVFASWSVGKVVNVDDVSPEVARRFMSHIAEAAAPKTFNDYLACLALTWKTFISDGYAVQNPWAWNKDTRAGIERKEKDTHIKNELTPEQLNALFAAADGETKTLFFIGTYTGLRLKDCVLLSWDAVDLAGGFIRLAPAKTKRHKIAVSIPILPPLAEALRLVLPASGEGGGYVMPELAERYKASRGKYPSKHIKTIFKHAGIKTTSSMEGRKRQVTDYGFHSLRHTFVSMAARAGIRQEVVRAIVGHTNAAMTAHYTHTNEADLKAAMAAFPVVSPQPSEKSDGGEAERRLKELARLVASMEANELKKAEDIIKAERKTRRAKRG